MKRILLIDNDRSDGLVFRRAFDQYSLRHETSAATGLAAAYFWHPELLLIDVNLPDVGGQVLAEQIQSDPLLRRIPIIFLSATLPAGVLCQPTTLKGWPAFRKPFDVAALRRYMEELFQPVAELVAV